MKNLIYFIVFSIVLGNVKIDEYYAIKLFGIKVADCIVSTSDTLIGKREHTKIEYIVNSTNFMDIFFNVNNYYMTIIDNENYKIRYYKKRQPNPI